MSRYKGTKFIFISPDELKMPKYIKEAIQEQGHAYYETNNLDEVIGSLDILYMTRVHKAILTNIPYLACLKYTALSSKSTSASISFTLGNGCITR